MFTIPSIQKIIVLVSILAAVWYGFKFLGRMKDERDREAREPTKRPAKKNRWSMKRDAPADAGPSDAEDMVECPVCRTFVAARGVRSCGKPGCPY